MAVEPKENEVLTDKQRLFADFYLGEARFNGTRAAMLAGYSEKSASVIASENLRKPNIRAYIDAELKTMTLGANEVLKRLTDIANGSVEDLLDEDGKFDFEMAKKAGKLPLVKKLKKKSTSKRVDRLTEGDGEEEETLETSVVYEEVEFEMYSAHEALRDLGKYHKLFTDRIEHDGDLNLNVSGELIAKIEKIYGRPDGD